jgi:hypothetical protein
MVELFRDKVGSGGSGGELSEVSASGGCQLLGGSTYARKYDVPRNNSIRGNGKVGRWRWTRRLTFQYKSEENQKSITRKRQLVEDWKASAGGSTSFLGELVLFVDVIQVPIVEVGCRLWRGWTPYH